MSKKVESFDIEQHIMGCWQVTDDLGTLLKMFDKGATEDQMMNLIIGIQELYNQKFDNFMDDYSLFLKTEYEKKLAAEKDIKKIDELY